MQQIISLLYKHRSKEYAASCSAMFLLSSYLQNENGDLQNCAYYLLDTQPNNLVHTNLSVDILWEFRSIFQVDSPHHA